MSENFGKCKKCNGKGLTIVDDYQLDCLSCEGSGMSGNAMDYVQKQVDQEWDRDRLYEQENGYGDKI